MVALAGAGSRGRSRDTWISVGPVNVYFAPGDDSSGLYRKRLRSWGASQELTPEKIDKYLGD